jgi:hypothetical protein
MRIRTFPDSPPPANGTAPFENGVNGAAHEGRDPATGKFLPGWKGGTGNPHARKQARLRHAFLDSVTPELMRTFVTNLVTQAGKGSVEHATLFLKYACGDPLPPVDPDGLDHHELLLLRQCDLSRLEAGGKCVDPAACVAAVKALMRATLRKALATGKLADFLVRADVQQALTEAGLADVVDEANVLRGRLK